MSAREAFEAFYMSRLGAPREKFGVYQDPDDVLVWHYLEHNIDVAWFFWQEAARQAMERAAQACLDQAAKTSITATDTRDPAFTLIDHAAITRCVTAIRALADVAGEKGVGNG